MVAPFNNIACRLRCAVVAPICVLAGCATYAPLPLSTTAAPKDNIEQLAGDAARLPERLSIDDVAMLTLFNNPDLMAARAQRGVAQAQMLAAGILPNPSLNASYGFLLSGPGTIGAITAGISQDVTALVTLSARRDAAAHAALEIDARVLWQEWQTVAKARLLAVDLIEGEKLRALIHGNIEQLQGLLVRSRIALAEGNTTLTALIPDLSAVAAASKQLDDLQRLQDTRRRDLNALLGLSPSVPLALSDHLELPTIDEGRLQSADLTLADRRPDLIALQLGYRAQEDKVRGAVLAQFPMLSIGVSGGRDTSDVRTLGPQITMDLPLFNRNQGNIAIETATRQQLHDEFNARLTLARAEVRGLVADIALLRAQLAAKQSQQAYLENAATNAKAAHALRDLDERAFVDVLSAYNAKQQEILAIEQTLLEQHIAVATLIGAGMPPVVFDSKEPKPK